MMPKEYEELHKLLQESKKVLVLTHNQPDPDAVCSSLMVNEALNRYYPHLDSEVKIQEPIPDYIYELNIPKINVINAFKTKDEVNLSEYDLVIIVDMADISRCIRGVTSDEIKDIKHIYIDHHTPDESSNPLLIINEGMAAATEQIYKTFKMLAGDKFEISKEFAFYTQLGLMTDSANFLYEKVGEHTFEVMKETRAVQNMNAFLITKTESPQTIKSNEVFTRLLQNTVFIADLAYTFVPDDFFTNEKYTEEDINAAKDFYIDKYIRFVKEVDWAFIIKKHTQIEGMYGVSLRGVQGVKSIVQFAKKLNGGGHEFSAGGKVEAESVEEAVEKVLSVVLE